MGPQDENSLFRHFISNPDMSAYMDYLENEVIDMVSEGPGYVWKVVEKGNPQSTFPDDSGCQKSLIDDINSIGENRE